MGSKKAGGRWNSPGLPVVYCAGSPALAVFESFVHLPADQRSPDGLPLMVLLAIDVPDEAVASNLVGLTAKMDIPACRGLGDAWLDAGSSLGLRVESTIVPFEANVLLNVRHPAMGSVAVASRHDYRFDPRLIQLR